MGQPIHQKSMCSNGLCKTSIRTFSHANQTLEFLQYGREDIQKYVLSCLECSIQVSDKKQTVKVCGRICILFVFMFFFFVK